MEKTQKKISKGTIIALIVLCLVVAAAAVTHYLLIPRGVEGEKAIVVEITADGSTTTREIRTNAAYLRGALEEASLVEGEETVFGLWVTTVNGRVANDADEEWWALYVNGDFAMLGVDDMPITDGDRFEYILKVGFDADW